MGLVGTYEFHISEMDAFREIEPLRKLKKPSLYFDRGKEMDHVLEHVSAFSLMQNVQLLMKK